ncbi:UDP-N-acetylmuramoyl-L-alanyl-D-glutamate--2,6-diaminopimelate ligase [Candidatus Peregrinibacteria bacterium]|nr:UDP-N-acetylmuramoyl-L-alanyl-D-glutamate--2,6-diaminopimelate ligase [Candidatus Peregrinibacteria bacterium]
MLQFLKDKISPTNPLRLFYHKMMAVFASIYYRFPSRYLTVVGVTGTKGKTTTTNLIASVLQEAGYKVGMTSTILFQIGDLKWTNTTKQTTLGPFFLQKMLRQMVNERCTHAVIEVSSHSLLQNRVWGVNFDMAVFTNIGEDHLDYHGGFDNYLRAKGLLFSKLNRSQRKSRIPKISILNKDDSNFNFFDQFLADKKYTYGMNSGTCFATDLEVLPTGSNFVLHIPNDQVAVNLKLPGAFNVYNAVAAATVGLANNVNVSVLKSALEKSSAIPGRFESIDCGQKFHVIVDYAHTTESLENLLSLYKGLTKGKLYLVFGATGGGRDKGKRPKMGAAADKYADMIIVTDDDPYSENEWDIVEDISAGIKRKEGEGFWKIPHREEAIKMALSLAQPGDTVLIAGKGAEEIQMIHGKAIPWDDRSAVRSLLARDLKVELK